MSNDKKTVSKERIKVLLKTLILPTEQTVGLGGKGYLSGRFTLSVLKIFVHFHLLSFTVIYHQRVVLTHDFFREIATFTSKLLTFDEFLSSSMIFFY